MTSEDPKPENETEAEASEMGEAADRLSEDDRTQPAAGIEAAVEPTLEERLAQAEAEIKASRERMLRVAADFENFRKRSARELDEVRRRATQEAVKVLLPVFDNLERATAHVEGTSDAKSMADGIRMVHRQFIDTLGKLDIERVEGVGATFDPAKHESIQYEHSEEHAAGTIMAELQPGYRMGAMLLRPALVVVSRGPASETIAPESDGDRETPFDPIESQAGEEPPAGER